MSKLSHTFHYKDESDFVEQMEEMLSKLCGMEKLAAVKARYPHLDAVVFSMRIKRFPENFPHKRNGRGLTELLLTRKLHRYLSRPLSQGRRDLQT